MIQKYETKRAIESIGGWGWKDLRLKQRPNSQEQSFLRPRGISRTSLTTSPTVPVFFVGTGQLVHPWHRELATNLQDLVCVIFCFDEALFTSLAHHTIHKERGKKNLHPKCSQVLRRIASSVSETSREHNIIGMMVKKLCFQVLMPVWSCYETELTEWLPWRPAGEVMLYGISKLSGAGGINPRQYFALIAPSDQLLRHKLPWSQHPKLPWILASQETMLVVL